MAEWTFPVFGHGGDYNPDQWRHMPGILEEDIRLMKLARCNLMSVGIFSWSALEPEEGRYDFGWLREVLDRLYANGIHVLLATPSGARPAWMSLKYPEVLRVRPDGHRNLHGGRHNHCPTSPVYREFVRRIDAKLSEAFGKHPAVVGWHISNEYGGDCHCELCQEAFRSFLKERYGTTEALNRAWWNGFWSKNVTDWGQLHSPTPVGEENVHGLSLDWRRFVTAQTVDFLRHETAAVRAAAPDLPVTTNMMLDYDGLDYYRFADAVDFVSFDCYPDWSLEEDDVAAAESAGFNYDMMRSIKGRPWVLMESTPSQVNWKPVCRPKRPGVHMLASMQAVAHGSDTVMYFQWRKSRGSSEKLHGAVVDHVGHEHTRVFGEVRAVGEALEKIAPVLGADTPRQAALLYDLENRWAQDAAQGPRSDKRYMETLRTHYGALKQAGLAVDVIDETKPFDAYRLLVLPQMYLVKPGVAERLKAFVRAGGIAVTTCMSGWVDENDLCILGGWPGGMMDLFGVWAEETDPLPPGCVNAVLITGDGTVPAGRYPCGHLCDVIHARGADVVGTYERDYYAGMPAVTRNRFGAGEAWYLATRMDRDFLCRLYAGLAERAGLEPVLRGLPYGVHADARDKDGVRYLFLQNFSAREQRVTVPEGVDLLSGERTGGGILLPVAGVRLIALTC